MAPRLRLIVTAGVAVLAGLLAVLSVVARVRSGPSTASSLVPAPLVMGTALERPRRVPAMPLIDASGRSVSTRAWRGKWVVLAPSLTLCHEVCPLTTGALTELVARLRAHGLAGRVVVAEVTVDPWRDSPARLRAYRRLSGAGFTLLTGTVGQIRRFWRFFGVYFARRPQGRPADVDWLTHRPETFDVAHSDGVFILDPAEQERITDVGVPQLGGRLSARLRGLLSAEGRRNLTHPELPWTASEVLDDLLWGMDREIPASDLPALPALTPAEARRALAGSPAALAALHRRADVLAGPASALLGRVRGLRGYPVVVNAWASWCGPCRSEFPLFATAAIRYGRRVAFLGADTDDRAGDARAFLHRHPVSYPSFEASSAQLTPLAVIAGMPTTIFIGRSGRVVGVHTGQYGSPAALDDDIARYALGGRG